MRKKETLSTRVKRLEDLHADLAASMKEIDEKVKILLDAQIKTDERFRQTDERFRQAEARFGNLDERVDKLVSAIGEFISRMPSPK